MSFNLKYDKEFDNYSDEDFLLHITNKFLFNWNNECLTSIASPELYVKKLIVTYDNVSREQQWYLIILHLLKKYGINYGLQYMNDSVQDTINYISQNIDIDMFLICESLNNACFIIDGDCLVSSCSEDEKRNGPLFDKIISLKKELMANTAVYVNKANLRKTLILKAIPLENMNNKYFDYNEFFFQMFIIYFFTSHEDNIMTGIPQSELDIRATCFEAVDQICDALLLKNKTKVSDIYCSTISNVQLKDGD